MSEYQYRSKFHLETFELEYEDWSVDIDWYKEYYKDFKCDDHTVVLNCCSFEECRTYKKQHELKQIFTSNGFDVRDVDFELDIRTNMHLMHQAKYIVTTDTATYWMAKSLGKEPYM